MPGQVPKVSKCPLQHGPGFYTWPWPGKQMTFHEYIKLKSMASDNHVNHALNLVELVIAEQHNFVNIAAQYANSAIQINTKSLLIR